MHALAITIICLILAAAISFASEADSCSWPAPGGGRLLDITVTTRTGLAMFNSKTGLARNWRVLTSSIAEGDDYNESWLSMNAHTGTHVDSPAHFLQEAYENGPTVEALNLHTLIGPVQVVQLPRGTNISASALPHLGISPDAHRVLFKTDNSAKNLMHQKQFDSSYTAFTADGAKYLVEHLPAVRLVGIDYMSIAVYEDVVQPHRILFRGNVIAVEGLDLREAEAGWYNLMCLPAKLGGADGAPVRCVLSDHTPHA